VRRKKIITNLAGVSTPGLNVKKGGEVDKKETSQGMGGEEVFVRRERSIFMWELLSRVLDKDKFSRDDNNIIKRDKTTKQRCPLSSKPWK
jgi:hypothetical protein